MTSRTLETPALPLLVDPAVFDDFAWCESDVLEWRSPAVDIDLDTPVDGSDPTRMVFVFHDPALRGGFLPRELARLHAPGLGLDAEEALAPFGIDDATDGLHQHRLRPRDVFWLAADNLNALFWGLHDWAHFHNHGPFERRAETERQCDTAALAWIFRNRGTLGLDEARFETLRLQVVGLVAGRYRDERRPFDESWLARDALVRLARCCDA